MKYIKGFYMSLGMFTGIPLPFHIWDEKYMPIMAASIPVVGLIVGTLWYLFGLLLVFLQLPVLLSAVLMAVAPFFVAGFIHLDGFMDTSDAYLSFRPLERRLEILKDPNVGAFAVVMLVILFFLQFAAMFTIIEHTAFGGLLLENRRYLALLVTIPVISRCCSALTIFVLRHGPHSNYAPMLAQKLGPSHKIFILLFAAVITAASFVFTGVIGLVTVGAVIVGHTWSMRTVYKSFKGVSGDLLGYALVIGEVCGLIGLAVALSIGVNLGLVG